MLNFISNENNLMVTIHEYGYVRYIDHFGSDSRVVEAARVSYRQPSKGDEADKKLLFFLYKNRHTSPFEQCNITFNIKLPIFVMRQLVRHRTARLNEVSGRYTELKDEFYLPDSTEWRLQDKKNKQGSYPGGVYNSGNIEGLYRQIYQVYKHMLENGVAKEMARIILPLATYTEIYFNIDLHNLLHLLRLRLDPHAQLEIQWYAEAMRVIANCFFPWTMEAFEKYKWELKEQEIL